MTRKVTGFRRAARARGPGAAHWLDLAPFYAEVRRVARPGAAIALVTHGVLHVADAAADAVAQHFYGDTLKPYWPPERKHVEDGCRALPFPFAPLKAPALAVEAAWRLADLIGYIETWSAVRAAEMAIGRTPIATFHAALTEAWGDPETVKRVRWPLSLRSGRIAPACAVPEAKDDAR